MQNRLISPYSPTLTINCPSIGFFDPTKYFVEDNSEVKIASVSDNFKHHFLGFENAVKWEEVGWASEGIDFTYGFPGSLVNGPEVFDAIEKINGLRPISQLWHIYELMKFSEKLMKCSEKVDKINCDDLWFVNDNYFFVEDDSHKTILVELERHKNGWDLWSFELAMCDNTSLEAYSRVFFQISRGLW